MLDGKTTEEEIVWGYPIHLMSNGRRHWPEELRAKVVEKIKAGAGIRETAEEIGANKSLVARWVKQATAADTSSAFFEVAPPKLTAAVKKTPSQVGATEAGFKCLIRIGDADVEISSGYPVEQLAELLRAVRASQ